MATLSSILAWKIPWTEDPGWLQSVGLQIVGRDWVHAHTHTNTYTAGALSMTSFSTKASGKILFLI